MSEMSTQADIEARYLPGVLKDIAALIGLPGTLRLVEAYGGVRLYVPKRIDAEHALAQLLGVESATQLAEVYGGELHFDIPRAVVATRAARDKSIRAERAAGSSHRALALQYRLSERQIRNVLGDTPETADDRQVGLF
jgi:Mor family transcriptional regulator